VSPNIPQNVIVGEEQESGFPAFSPGQHIHSSPVSPTPGMM